VGRNRAIELRWWLTQTEAADALGVSRWTIQRMLRDGSLPHAVVGRSRVIRKADIEALLTESRAS
jgi:excisionase family DNA binding protein